MSLLSIVTPRPRTEAWKERGKAVWGQRVVELKRSKDGTQNCAIMGGEGGKLRGGGAAELEYGIEDGTIQNLTEHSVRGAVRECDTRGKRRIREVLGGD